MRNVSRKLVKSGDLNANNSLFGGRLLEWIDEAAGVYAMTKLETKTIVTKYMSEIDFIHPANLGDIVEIGMEMVSVGRTSITFSCHVRNVFDKQSIITINKIVMVNVNDDGEAIPHEKTL